MRRMKRSGRKAEILVTVTAAVLLGAESAVGVDIDAQSVKTARENAELNSQSGKTEYIVGDLADKVSGKFNVVGVLGAGPHGGHGALKHFVRRHAQFCLHVQGRRCNKGVNTAARRRGNRFTGAFNVLD